MVPAGATSHAVTKAPTVINCGHVAKRPRDKFASAVATLLVCRPEEENLRSMKANDKSRPMTRKDILVTA